METDLPDGSPTDALTPISSENPSAATPPLPAHNAGQGADNRSGRSSSSNSCSCKPAKRKASAENELLVLARNRLLNTPNVREEDQYDTFSKTIGHKLRNLPTPQSIHAQKLISDIIYEAELGTLSRHTTIVNRNPAYEQQQQQQHPFMESDVYRSYDYL